jgi:hypothetical protein
MPYDAQHALEHPETAAWALGALDPDDSAAFEEHLQSCQQCQEQAAEFSPVARSLTLAAPADIPPPDLLSKTLAAVRYAAMTESRIEPEPEPEPRPGLDVPGHPPASRASRRSGGEDQAPTRVYPIPPRQPPAQAETRGYPSPAPQRQPPAQAETRVYPPPAAKPATTEPDASAPVTGLSWWRRHRGRLISAVAVAAAIIVAAIVVLPRLGGGPATGALAFKLVPPPGSGQASASGMATARPDASGSWDVTLTVHHLQAFGDSPWYECWYASQGHQKVVSAGTFLVPKSGSGTFSMTSAVDPNDFPTMDITIESPSDNGARRGTVVLTGQST